MTTASRVTIGSAIPRSFAADGRLIIAPKGETLDRWREGPIVQAEALARALDVFFKVPDLRVGRDYTFELVSQSDPGPHGDRFAQYGIRVPIPLDWEWFRTHAVIDDGWGHRPDTAWPVEVGPGINERDRGGLPFLSPYGRIDSTVSGTDAKWGAVGFMPGEPWDGRMPRHTWSERHRATKQEGVVRAW